MDAVYSSILKTADCFGHEMKMNKVPGGEGLCLGEFPWADRKLEDVTATIMVSHSNITPLRAGIRAGN
jgi:hypothetical protein